ncbi:glutamate racemase [Actinoplanes teichomyceticus]|uniref:Glutamate racemase n=1 Tax=Actinoplanes teichomyceticus TaxID=1867 RepID=A0A561WKC5_ACTTI|nr:glutamate racemase [Actinoplanes teichomyceticus]TWG24324.1 glutamate racemase [Actinoplanes teichomyceticus]GIF12827.1 glutamate racemase [Actinoplanes teichomyceticus]
MVRRADGAPRGPRTLTIGVFDSGVGGLTVTADLRQALPDARIVYLADTAHAPYGNKPPDQVVELVLAGLDRLVEAGADVLVVACNTAAAAGLAVARSRYPVPVVDVVAPTARAAIDRLAAAGAVGRPIGVLGTAATIAAGVYPRALSAVAGATVVGVAGPELVTLVERGTTTGALAGAVVRRRVAPIVEAGVGALILGCTHFPFLAPAIRAAVGDAVPLVTAGPGTAAATAAAVGREVAYGPRPASRDLLATVDLRCTGDPRRFARTVERLFARAGAGDLSRPMPGDHRLPVTV